MKNTVHSTSRLTGNAAALAAMTLFGLAPVALVAQGPPSMGGPGLPAIRSGTSVPTAESISLRPIQGGQLIARVGSQVVLLSELMWPIHQELAKRNVPLEAVEQIREQAAASLQVQLARMLDDKLILSDLYETVPPEGIEKATEQLSEPFEGQLVPLMVKEFGVKSRGELDARLRQYGSSLSQVRQGFVDARLARMWMDEKTSTTSEITLEDLRREYDQHVEDYAHPAKVRWQELMVRYDRLGGDKNLTYRTLAEMGNQVLDYESGHGGAPFETIAKQHSHGFTASNGGLHGWTAQGSLVAEEVDAALFMLPIGRPSEIIQSSEGCHIVRVLERQEAGRTPFEEAQAAIREKLVSERRTAKQREFIEKLRREVQVWTIFTGPEPTTAEAFSKRLATAPG
jgi:hypothetical protein